MEVVWTDLAVESLADIFAYVQNFFGKRTASSTAKKVIDFVESLGNAPYLGKHLAHLSHLGEVRCVAFSTSRIISKLFWYGMVAKTQSTYNIFFLISLLRNSNYSLSSFHCK